MAVENDRVKILILGAHPRDCELYAAMLEKENFDVHMAGSVEAALAMLCNGGFDLILQDVVRPIKDATEAFGLIKENPETGSVPIVLIASEADIDSLGKGLAPGTADYVRKPVHAVELAARVGTQVELRRMRKELGEKDIKLQQASSELERLVTTDPLTRLCNRREALTRIEQELVRFERNGIRFAALISDIDRFRGVNEAYGQACGDFILKSVADILRSSVRKQDTVARWGSEEFLLLLPATGRTGAAVLAEKLRKRVEDEVFTYNGAEIRITMTFGVSDISESENVDGFVRLADEALGQGKREGGNRVVSERS